jgi:hypothetical protein
VPVIARLEVWGEHRGRDLGNAGKGVGRALRPGGHVVKDPRCVSGHARLTIAKQPGISVSLSGECHLFGYQKTIEKSFRLGQGLVCNILTVLAVIINPSNLTNSVDTAMSVVRLARR